MAFSDWLHGTWKEQRANFVWLLLCLIATALMGAAATLTKGLTGWQHFGTIAILALFLIWAVIATIRAAQVPFRRVTVNNIEDRLREWILNFRLGNQRLPDNPNSHFSYQIMLPMGILIVVTRSIGVMSNYLSFYSIINFKTEQLTELDLLGDKGRSQFTKEYVAECTKARTSVVVLDEEKYNIRTEKIIPITAYLSESDFLAALGALQQDLAIAITQIEVCISRVKNNLGSAMQPLLSTPSTATSQTSPAS